ncbi:acyl-CoA dehydrogenase family protein, partial [Chloroflexota bacterium]
LAVLYEEMGRAMFPSPHLSTVVLCGLTILAAGDKKQKAEFLPKIVEGDMILALALTETTASWDAEGIKATATACGDDYIINGTKLFIHDANIADYFLCAAITNERAQPNQSITLFLVDAKDKGISQTLLKTTAGDKQSEVVFDSVKVPGKNMVGKINGGWYHLEKVLNLGAVMLCAEMVGAGQSILELTMEHAKTRIRFDLPIGIHQHVQEHCIHLLSEVDGSRWVTYQAAWKLSQNLPCDMEVAIAKAWASDAHERACWRAHQVFAGVGFNEEFVLSLYTRRAKSAQLYLGDAAHYRNKIARQLDGWNLEIPKGKPLGLWENEEREQPSTWLR